MAKMIKVKMLTTMADERGCVSAGKTVLLDEVEARELIKLKYAEEVKIETATASSRETATAPVADEGNRPNPPRKSSAKKKPAAASGVDE